MQVVWPDLDRHLVSVTEEWTAIVLAGPRSRDVLARITDDIDVAAMPCRSWAYGSAPSPASQAAGSSASALPASWPTGLRCRPTLACPRRRWRALQVLRSAATQGRSRRASTGPEAVPGLDRAVRSLLLPHLLDGHWTKWPPIRAGLRCKGGFEGDGGSARRSGSGDPSPIRLGACVVIARPAPLRSAGPGSCLSRSARAGTQRTGWRTCVAAYPG